MEGVSSSGARGSFYKRFVLSGTGSDPPALRHYSASTCDNDMADFRDKLAAAVPSASHLLLFRARGSKYPPLNELSVIDSFHKFVAELLPLSPIRAPRDKMVKIIENNFPKFLNLEPRKKGDPAKPILLVRMIKAGTIDLSRYTWERDRIENLFWMPEVLGTPDAIYKNCHCVVDADEVYVKVYDKMGSKVKLAFTKYLHQTKETVVVTSYLATPNRAISCCEGQPLWLPPKE